MFEALHAGEGYKIFYPIYAGHLNVNSEHSLQTTVSLLHNIWHYAISEKLHIKPNQLKVPVPFRALTLSQDYYIVLIIPEAYEQLDVQEMLNLLFNKFGVKGVIIHLVSA